MSHLLQRLIARASAPISPAQPILPSVYASHGDNTGIETQDSQTSATGRNPFVTSHQPAVDSRASQSDSSDVAFAPEGIKIPVDPPAEFVQRPPRGVIHQQRADDRGVIPKSEGSDPIAPRARAEPEPSVLRALPAIERPLQTQPAPHRRDTASRNGPSVTPQAPSIEVNVSIGHIEVRSSPSTPPPARHKPVRPRMTLEGFLNRRGGGESR